MIVSSDEFKFSCIGLYYDGFHLKFLYYKQSLCNEVQRGFYKNKPVKSDHRTNTLIV
jgi:hypothetical protein